MTIVTFEEVKERLDALLAEAAKGGEVVIEGESGKTFKLVPLSEPKKKRGFVGSGKGWFVMREDFDEPIEGFECG